MVYSLIVSFLLQPTARVATQVEATGLVVDENGQHEWNSGQPPHESVFKKKEENN